MESLKIFDYAEVIRDSYGKFVAENEAERKAELTKARRIYRPGKELNNILEGINKRHDAERQKRRTDVLNEFDNGEDGYNACVNMIRSKVENINPKVLEYLRSLDGYPISSTEFDFLCEKYGGLGYWPDKTLQMIADRNGICYDAGLFDPDAEGVMATLKELRERVVSYLDHAGEGSLTEVDALHSARLKKLEDRLVPGKDPKFSPEKQANRLLSEVAQSRDILSQSQKINNVLETADEDVRKYFLLGLESRRSNILDSAIAYSGAAELIDMEHRSNVRNKKLAEQAVAELRSGDPENWHAIAKALEGAGGKNNPLLFSEVTGAFGTDNGMLNDVLDALEIKPTVSADS